MEGKKRSARIGNYGKWNVREAKHLTILKKISLQALKTNRGYLIGEVENLSKHR